MALIWVVKHKEMQSNKDLAVYSDCLAEREKVRSRPIGFRFVVKLQTGKELVCAVYADAVCVLFACLLCKQTLEKNKKQDAYTT